MPVEDEELATPEDEPGAEGDPVSPSEPPPPDPPEDPDPPKAGDGLSDLVSALKEQNQVTREQNKLLEENVKMTRELHEVVFNNDDEIDETQADPDKTKPTVVEPEPPPQPHQKIDEPPNKPERTGWRRFY